MKKVIVTSQAPKPIGPYSQAIQAGGFLFLSGQVATDPKVGKIVETDIKGQTRQTLDNLMAVLKEAGYSPKDVVKTTVFLADTSHFAAMNEVYATYFPTEPPARSTVGVKFPRPEILVEIELVAWKPGGQ